MRSPHTGSQSRAEAVSKTDYETAIRQAMHTAGYPGRRERLFLHRMVCTRLSVQMRALGASDEDVASAMERFDREFAELDETFQNERDFGQRWGLGQPPVTGDETSKGDAVANRTGRALWTLIVIAALIIAVGVIANRP